MQRLYMKNRDPGLASVFSFLVPGLGQIYIGKLGWGMLHFLLHIGLCILAFVRTYPLLAIESSASFAERLLAWLRFPSNMGLIFGILFFGLGNWIWSIFTASQQDDYKDDSRDIVDLVKAARSEYFADTAKKTINESASSLEKTTSYNAMGDKDTEPEIQPAFAITLAELMDLKGMGIKDLAEITGISESQISKFLKGVRPDNATVNTLARGLNVSPRFLIN